MMINLFRQDLLAPHIPLGIPEEEGLKILGAAGKIEKDPDAENCYSVRTSSFSLAIYVTNEIVTSTWFDDPVGRKVPGGKARKVKSYLKRYGQLVDWEMRMDNGWMHYWFNDKEGVQMVYGIH